MGANGVADAGTGPNPPEEARHQGRRARRIDPVRGGRSEPLSSNSQPKAFGSPITRRRILAYTLGGGALAIALILLVSAWAIIQGRVAAHRAAEVATTNLSQSLADNFASTIEKIDLGLLAVLDELSRQQKFGSNDDRQIIDTIARQDAATRSWQVFAYTARTAGCATASPISSTAKPASRS